MCTLPNILQKVTSFKTAVQHHKQDTDMDTEPFLHHWIPQGTFCSLPPSLPP